MVIYFKIFINFRKNSLVVYFVIYLINNCVVYFNDVIFKENGVIYDLDIYELSIIYYVFLIKDKSVRMLWKM